MRFSVKPIIWPLVLVHALVGCAMDVPEVPAADFVIQSITPAEFSDVNNTSTLSVTYTWKIKNYDPQKRYAMQILQYDTNLNWLMLAKSFEITSASGITMNVYSGAEFYTCFFGLCTRKAALPFRLYFTIEQLEDASSSYGTTLARTREYIYN